MPLMTTLIPIAMNSELKDDVTVVLAHDTEISPEQREAIQLGQKLLEKYLGNSVVCSFWFKCRILEK